MLQLRRLLVPTTALQVEVEVQVMRERESKAVCRDWVGVAVCLIGDRVARFHQQRHCYSHTRLLKCISQQRAGRCSSNERGYGTKSSHKHHRDTRHHHHKQQPEEQQTTTTTQQQQQQQRNDEGERRKTNSHNGRCEAFCSGSKAMCAYAKQLLWLESCQLQAAQRRVTAEQSSAVVGPVHYDLVQIQYWQLSKSNCLIFNNKYCHMASLNTLLVQLVVAAAATATVAAVVNRAFVCRLRNLAIEYLFGMLFELDRCYRCQLLLQALDLCFELLSFDQ
jgi:hypothetical protein